MICSCGNNRYIGHQILRTDVIVDESGSFYSNMEGGLESAIYDSGKPYGPFTCTKCRQEYDELEANI